MDNDPEQLNKEQRAARFVRISVVLTVFILLVAGYNFILPIVYPEVVLRHLPDPRLTQRAYFYNDKTSLEKDLIEAVVGTTHDGLFEDMHYQLKSGDKNRQLKAMLVMRYCRGRDVYKALSPIFLDRDQDRELRLRAAEVLSELRQMNTRERSMLFTDEDFIAEKQWAGIVIQQSRVKACNEQEKAAIMQRIDAAESQHDESIAAVIAAAGDPSVVSLERYVRFADAYDGWNMRLRRIMLNLSPKYDSGFREQARCIQELFKHDNEEVAVLAKLFFIQEFQAYSDYTRETIIQLLQDANTAVNEAAFRQLMAYEVFDKRIAVWLLQDPARQRVDDAAYIPRLLAQCTFTMEEEQEAIRCWQDTGKDVVLCGLMQTEHPEHQRVLINNIKQHGLTLHFLHLRKRKLPGVEPCIIKVLNDKEKTAAMSNRHRAKRAVPAAGRVSDLSLYQVAAAFDGLYREKAEFALIANCLTDNDDHRQDAFGSAAMMRKRLRVRVSFGVFYKHYARDLTQLFVLAKYKPEDHREQIRTLLKNPAMRICVHRWVRLIDRFGIKRGLEVQRLRAFKTLLHELLLKPTTNQDAPE